jgi:toxin-antitoxin system PIN domain toxin
MSYSVDINILLYSVNQASSFHAKAVEFFPKCLEKEETCCLVWDVLYGFMRISTLPSVFSSPLTPEIASENMAALAGHPRVELLGPTPESWDIFRRLCREVPVRGNLVPDAVIASILEANGIRKIYTHDRDFWKFPYLKPVDPLTAG